MELLEFAGNVGLALVLGVLIGLEREITHHAAGLRTNALVAVGAALFASVTALVPEPNSPTRVAANIVVGVGFLGGGVILKEGLNIRGLTTAAGIWCSAAVGTLAGLGLSVHALVGTGFVLVVLVGFYPLDAWLDRTRSRLPRGTGCYRVRVRCGERVFETVRDALVRLLEAVPGARVVAVESERQPRRRVLATAELVVRPDAPDAVRAAVDRLRGEDGVVGVGWQELPSG
jgi:putative Mg2+ transporter-C (MgtC) family protein